MRGIAIYVIVGVLIGALHTVADVCRFRQWRVCPGPLPEAMRAIDNFLPSTQILDKYCPYMLGTIRCYMLYNHTCHDSYRDDFPFSYEVVNGLGEKVCDANDELGKTYRIKIHCILSIKEDVMRTIDEKSSLLRTYRTFLRKEFKDFDYRKHDKAYTCSIVPVYEEAITDLFQKNCGSSAAKMVKLAVAPFLDECVGEQQQTFQDLLKKFMEQSEW